MPTQEWDSLPWWEQRMYVEGFETEGLMSTGPVKDQDETRVVTFGELPAGFTPERL